MAEIELVLRGRVPGGSMLNVIHYETNTFNAAELQEGVDYIGQQWVNRAASVFSTSFTFEDCYITPMIDGGIGLPYTPASWPASGTNADDEHFPQACALVRKINRSGSRPRYGRAYVGGLSCENIAANGTWNVTVVNALLDFWNSIRVVPITTEPFDWNMLIKAANPTAPNTVAYATVDEFFVPAVGAVQRRRRYGTGS